MDNTAELMVQLVLKLNSSCKLISVIQINLKVDRLLKTYWQM